MTDPDRQNQERLQRRLNEALAAAWAGLQALEAAGQSAILKTYETAAAAITKALQAAADAEGIVPVAQTQAVVNAVTLALESLRVAEETIVQQQIVQAAINGAGTIQELQAAARSGAVPVEALTRLPDMQATMAEVAQQVANGLGDDGLTLSDRLWRINRALREQLLPEVQTAIVRAEEARTTVRSILIQGGKATDAEVTAIELARAGALGEKARAILTGDQAQAYANVLRVVRTETDRANILSTRAAAYATEGVIGTRFMLSPAHPRFDICDVHASVNLYGLGPGVYPKGKSPLPAHPNTLSYEEAVFEWEVTPDDHQNRDDVLTWLGRQSEADQLGVLQSADKLRAFKAGVLQPEELTTPWRELRSKYGPQVGT